jgi:hypothetical protein
MSFKFIDPTSTSVFTAADASGITQLPLPVGYPSGTVEDMFCIGNTGTSGAAFSGYLSGTNSGLIDITEFSTDGQTWDSGFLTDIVDANAISDFIYVRGVIPEDAYIGSGTVLLNITEI